ncbi:MAG: translocation protein TolB [Bdellovibrionales bacterium]
MKLRFFFFFMMCAFLCFAQFNTSPSWAQSGQIYIDVGQATVKKSLIALPPLTYFGSDSKNRKNIDIGQDLFKVIFNDLTVSNYFTFIKQEAFLEDPAKTTLKPAPGDAGGFNFKNWSTIGAEFLIRGGYRVKGETLSLEIYVYHVAQAKLIFGKTYEGGTNKTRVMAHTFANDLVKALTSKPGIFLTKFTAVMRENIKAAKEVYVMDWDGANITKISNHKSIAISPAWSPKGDRVAYTAFAYHENIKSRNADLFIYELASAKRWLVSYRKGINSGANFFPDGENLLMTLSQAGTPDIYKVTTDGKTMTRITNGPNRSMNVEPAVSPDGSKIAFSSDRSGQPMIYVMNINGSNIKRLTFAGRYNSSPSWSPDGKTLAFAGYDKDHFDIFTVNIDGTGLKRLTEANKTNGKPSDNRDPSFSPDGRHVVFTSNRTGTTQIYIIDPEGNNERRITTDRSDWEQPKWSRLLE